MAVARSGRRSSNSATDATSESGKPRAGCATNDTGSAAGSVDSPTSGAPASPPARARAFASSSITAWKNSKACGVRRSSSITAGSSRPSGVAIGEVLRVDPEVGRSGARMRSLRHKVRRTVPSPRRTGRPRRAGSGPGRAADRSRFRARPPSTFPPKRAPARAGSRPRRFLRSGFALRASSRSRRA